MMVSNVFKLCLNIIIAVNIQNCLSCPAADLVDAKAAYKSGNIEIHDQAVPITVDKIKQKLKEAAIFDPFDEHLSYRDKKELNKLFDAVEIMTTSRNRQPSNVQNMFSSLRMVERVVKKQLKEGQISESLASRFHWENLFTPQRTEKPTFTLDEKTKMRVFNVKS